MRSATKNIVVGTEKVFANANYVYLDIVRGEAIAFDDLFTVVTNTGRTSGITVRYVINGEDTYVDTSHLDIGQHTLYCQAYLDNGEYSSSRVFITVVTGDNEPLSVATNIQVETSTYRDIMGNTLVVPGGFKVRTDLALTVAEGIVIEDKDGNQFVWVPIGTIIDTEGNEVNIELARYSFSSRRGHSNTIS